MWQSENCDVCANILYWRICCMDKYIFDESNGSWHELQGDYYIPCLILSEEETQPIGLWGQRHKQKKCKDWFDLYLTYRNTGKAAKLFGVPRLMEIDFFIFCDILQLSKECDDILLTILISEVQVWKELKP